MADETLSIFNSSLPDTATEIITDYDFDGNTVSLSPSFLNVTIENGGLLNGVYDAWCVNSLFDITRNTYENAEVYSSYGNIPTGILYTDSQTIDSSPDPYLDKLQQINWLLNNVTEEANVVNDKYNYQGVDYTWSDVQLAIWELLGETSILNDRDFSALQSYSQENVDALVNLAITNGTNFIPVAGQDFGVIVKAAGQQPILMEVKTAGLGDFVWHDLNANGVQDAGEQGIDGVTVTLLDDSGNVLGTTVTGDNPLTAEVETGYYQFGPLLPSSYQVQFSLPTDFDAVSPYLQGDTSSDSNANPDNNLTSTLVTLEAGEVNPTIDAGFYKFASLGDYVWVDSNANGLQDDGNTGLNGVTVNLKDANGNVIATTQTTNDSNGNAGYYLFDNLVPGDYSVEFVKPAGYEFTVQDAGADDIDSDADTTTGMTIQTTLTSGENDLSWDAGLIQLIPDIEIKKFVNGEDADTADEAVAILAGDDAIFTYQVTNTGNVAFAANEVVVTDDNGTAGNTSDDFNPNQVLDNGFNVGDTNQNNLLDSDETWLYTQTLVAEDLSTTTTTTVNNVIDFEGFAAGTVIDDEYASLGVTISATGGSNQAMIFDSANPTGGDHDLATPGYGLNNTTPQGNILIISEDGDSSDPDDEAHGGTITFNFDNAVNINSLSFVDIEESGGKVFTTDAQGNVTTTNIAAPGDNSFQTLTINDNDVVKVEVDLVGSGSISGLNFDSFETITTPGLYTNVGRVVAGTVEDTDVANYINLDPDPGIKIEKFVNGIDVTDLNNLPEIAVGADVTFTYTVKNTGNIDFAANEITITDDNGTAGNTGDDFTPTLVASSDVNSDGILSAGETWTYTSATETAQDLSTTTSFQDIRFYLTGNSYTTGSYGNVRTFTQDGVSVDVSAFSSNKSGGDWKTAYLGAYGGGLGVTNRHESGSGHRVDNGGSNDYILFEFDQKVTVDRAFLDYIDGDSDISVWIGDRNGDISLLDSSILSSFTKENNNGGSGGSDDARWANFNANELTGNTLVISARDDHNHDAFKLRKLDISAPGETSIGNYINTATVTAGTVSDSDASGYTNPTPNPGIDIEKFVNGIDVTDLNYLPEIAVGADVTFTYTVENTGNVAFAANEITITDDNGTAGHTGDDFTPTLVASSDVNSDGILSAGETWTYTSATEAAQDLTINTGSEDIRFTFSGSSNTTGTRGNTRSFSQDGVSVDVSAFSSNKHFGDWRTGYLGLYGGGLGVTNKYESGSSHRVDNGGSLDYLLFEFDQDVTVDRAYLKYVGHDSDISVWIGDRNGADISALDNSLLSSFVKENNFTHHGSDRWADFNNGELSGDTLIISAYTGGSNDSFKLNKLDISVPGETSIGIYQNVATVSVGDISDSDVSGYTNPIV